MRKILSLRAKDLKIASSLFVGGRGRKAGGQEKSNFNTVHTYLFIRRTQVTLCAIEDDCEKEKYRASQDFFLWLYTLPRTKIQLGDEKDYVSLYIFFLVRYIIFKV